MEKTILTMLLKAEKVRRCTLVLTGCILLAGCTNDPEYMNPHSGIQPGKNPMADLVIAKGFDWSTIRTVDITVNANDMYQGQYDYVVEIFDQNPLNNTNANTLAKGVAKAGNPYSISLSVPKGMNTLFIRQTDPRKRSVIRTYDIESTQNVTADFTTKSGKRSLATRTMEKPTIPEYTSTPAGAIEISEQNAKPSLERPLQEGGIYKITGDYSGTFTHTNAAMKNAKIFVEGNWNIPSSTFQIETGIEIILLAGSKVTGNNVNLVGTTSLYVAPGGSIELATLECNNRTRIYNLGELSLAKLTDNPEFLYNGETGKLTITQYNPGNSTIYNYGLMHFTQFTTSNAGSFFNGCFVEIEETFTFKEGKLFMDQGAIMAKNMSIKGAINLNNGSMLSASSTIDVPYGGTFSGGTGENRSLIQAPKFTLGGGHKFEGSLTIESDNFPADQGSWFYQIVSPAELAGYKQSTVNIVTCEGEANGGNPGDSITTPEWPMVYTDSTNYSFAYEDNWPLYGDHDMNDIVIYLTSRQFTKQEDGQITQLKITGKLLTVGASKRIAAALRLMNTEASKVNNVTYNYSGTGADFGFFERNSANLETGHPKAVIPIFSNAHEFLTGQSGMLEIINTLETLPFLKPRDFELTVTFNEGVWDSDLDIQYMDLFIITDEKNSNRVEVHLPTFNPTDKADPYYVGIGNCEGSEAPYLSTEGLSFALMIPAEFAWPIEYEAITNVYSRFAAWAQSSGTTNMDWYKGTPLSGSNPIEYQMPSNVYKIK